jgi:hypothetical protein
VVAERIPGRVWLLICIAVATLCLSCADECTDPGCVRPQVGRSIKGYIDFEPRDDDTPLVNDHPDEDITVMLDTCAISQDGRPECSTCNLAYTSDDSVFNFVFEDVKPGLYKITATQLKPNSDIEFWMDAYKTESALFEHTIHGDTEIRLSLDYQLTIPYNADIIGKLEYEHLPDPDPDTDNCPDDGISAYLFACTRTPGGEIRYELIDRYVTTDREEHNLFIKAIPPGEYMIKASKWVAGVPDPQCSDIYCAESPIFEHRKDQHSYVEMSLTYCYSICPY